MRVTARRVVDAPTGSITSDAAARELVARAAPTLPTAAAIAVQTSDPSSSSLTVGGVDEATSPLWRSQGPTLSLIHI
eukprot:6485484-Prymnesium_polylepis.1